jgi:NAD-dependent DNA ligase
MNIETLHINRLVPFYLMSSYLYYKEDKQVLTDEDFDKLAKRLLDNWDSVEHIHKHLISKEDLQAGTGYAIQYSQRVINAAKNWEIGK